MLEVEPRKPSLFDIYSQASTERLAPAAKDKPKEFMFPVKGGERRTTLPLPESSISLVEYVKAGFKAKTAYGRKLLEVIEYLAMFNPDMSYALDNVVQLSSTTHNLTFSSEVTPEQRAKMVFHIDSVSKRWYWQDNGLSSLISDLFTQCVLTGGVSAEVVPNLSFDGLEKIVLVHPKYIDFFFDKELGQYVPYQQVSGLLNTSKDFPGYVKLNTNQYKYFAMRRFNDSPYAVPSFLSALEHTKLEQDMLANLRNIISKVGAFGFLNVKIRKPARGSFTSDAAYEAECTRLLVESEEEAGKGFSNGLGVSFIGDHEFDLLGQPSNITGSEALFNLVNTLKISGLKQDPLMLGRNFSTTEAIGRVILTKLSEQIDNYQTVVGNFLEYAIALELRLAGFTFNALHFNFDKPLVSDVKKEEEARGFKIDNTTKLYQQGIISQEEYANLVGFEKPDQKEPRGPVAVGNQFPYPGAPTSKKDGEGKAGANKKAKSANAIDAKVLRLANIPEFAYGVTREKAEEDLAWMVSEYGVLDGALGKWFKEYYQKTLARFGLASKNVGVAVADKLSELPENTSEDEVLTAATAEIYNQWSSEFINPQEALTGLYVSKLYTDYRLREIDGKTPEGLDSADFNYIQYFTEFDNLYLGKFITDKDTQTRLRAFLKEAFTNGRLPNQSAKELAASFAQSLSYQLDLEDWKLQRVINTSINRVRNSAYIKAMSMTGVQKYMIQGRPGPKQCAYCKAMGGKIFSVSATISLMDLMKTSSPSKVRSFTPFINSIFQNAAEIDTVDNLTLQNYGLSLPPFHGNCVDIVVPV